MSDTKLKPLWDVDRFLDRLSEFSWRGDPEEDNEWVTVGAAVFVAMQMQAEYEAERVAMAEAPVAA